MPFVIVRDSREQQGWEFDNMVIKGLKTGDYSLEGYEKTFVIERKGSVKEFYSNLIQDRFENELKRLEEYEFPFILLEFDFDKLMLFPEGSGIPRYVWPKLKIKPKYLIRRLAELQTQYKTKILFVGNYGKQMAISLFYRIKEYDRTIT